MQISVIIPTYNSRKYIAAAVQSALSQTSPPFEIIVVDDGSIDGTAPYLKGLFGSTIEYIYQGNKGPAAARNAGARAARGDWLAFLDSDDTWLPTKLEEQASLAQKQPNVPLICCEFFRKAAETDLSRAQHCHLVRPFSRSAVRNYLRIGNALSPCTALVRKDVFEKLGGFDERFHCGEDREFWARLILEHDVAAVLKPLVIVNERSDGVSSNPATLIRDVTIINQHIGQLLRSTSLREQLADRIALNKAESRLFASAGWLYLQRNSRGKALFSVLRSLLFWPLGNTNRGLLLARILLGKRR